MSSGVGGDDGRTESTAGAWAAAAVVLALGALVFGVVAELQAHDLGIRVTTLEHRLAGVDSTPPSTSLPASGDPSKSAGSTSTLASIQPADPAGAEAEIRTAFVAVYDGSRPASERLVYIEDPDGVLDAFEKASTGSLADVSQSMRSDVSKVTFTSSVTATVSYSISAGGTTAQRLGSARLVGGSWKVSHATVCADLAAAGAACSG